VTLFKRSVSARGAAAFAGEILLIFGSVAAAMRLHDPAALPATVLWKAGLTAFVCQLILYYNDFYDLTLVQSSRELVVRLLQSAGAAAIVLAALYLAIPAFNLGSGVVVTALCLFLVVILAWRLVFYRIADSRHLEERVLIVGTGSAARTVARQILIQRDFGYRLVGFVDDDAGSPVLGAPRAAVLGTPSDIPRIVDEYNVSRIVVGIRDRRGRLPIQELMHAKLSGVRVEDATETYERITGKILVDNLRPSWLIFSDGFHVSRLTRAVKRFGDLALALFGALLGMPLMVLTGVAIWLETGRPILYRQERVGENGRTFTLYKFRSMRTDAESSGKPVWARDRDDRVTAVGRVIRTTRLDELPQLWNVVRGDMSFVGPRPERPFFVEQLSAQIPFYPQRHAVKPGLTGWAQVRYRYGASVEDAMEKLRYDLYYIKNLSLGFDLTIMFDTVKVILFGKGAK
jgi:sugar transferase (PEP-CTERM system associated)